MTAVRRRAVIFDDNDSIRRCMWNFFDQRGYEVFSFPSLACVPSTWSESALVLLILTAQI